MYQKIWLQSPAPHKLREVACVCNHNLQKVVTVESEGQSEAKLHSIVEVNLGYMRPYWKKKM